MLPLHPGLSALLFGATGATGKHVLRELLSSDQFAKVGEYGRRVTDKAQLANTEKLEQKVVNFDKIEQESVKEGNWDVVYITCAHDVQVVVSALGLF